MKNGTILLILIGSSFLFSCKTSKGLQKDTKMEVSLTPLTVDTIKALNLAGLLPKVQFYISDSLVSVKEVSVRRIVTIDDGSVVEKIYAAEGDSLIISPLTKGAALEVFKDPKSKQIVLRVGFEEDASIPNQKFLFFGPDKIGDYVLYTKSKAIAGESRKVFYYAQEEYVIVSGSGTLLLFSMKQENSGSAGKAQVLQGKEVSKPQKKK